MPPHLLLFWPWSRIPDGSLTDNIWCVSLKLYHLRPWGWDCRTQGGKKWKAKAISINLFAPRHYQAGGCSHFVCLLATRNVAHDAHGLLDELPAEPPACHTAQPLVSMTGPRAALPLAPVCWQRRRQLLGARRACGRQGGDLLLWPAPETCTWASREESGCLLGACMDRLCQFISPFQKKIEAQLIHNIVLIVQYSDLLYIYIYIYMSFFIFFSIVGHYEILSVVSCAPQ